MKNLNVRQLIDFESEINQTIAKWLYDEWMKDEGYLFEEVLSYVKYHQTNDQAPAMFGMFLNGKIIGTYTLGFFDLTARPDIFPWLENVYVDKEYRKKGYGSFMMQTVKENAKRLLKDYDKIHLYTKIEGFYEKFGWQKVCDVDTISKNPRIQKIYCLNLK